MTLSFAYHVFSHDGMRYRTTRAAGVTRDQSAALEQFFFGQTNDPAYLASLEREPGVIWRRLETVATLTRVRPGKQDANQRATLRFETLILPRESVVTPALILGLVCGRWTYFDDRVEVTPAAQTPAKLHPQRISDILMNLDGSERIVRQAAAISLADVARIVSERAPDPEFSLAYKSLNARAPVTVNLASGAVSESTMKTIRTTASRNDRGSDGRPAYAGPGTARPSPVVVGLFVAVIALQLISLWSGRARPPSDLDTMQDHLITRIQSVDDNVNTLREKQSKAIDTLITRIQSVDDNVNTLREKQAKAIDTLQKNFTDATSSIGDKINAASDRTNNGIDELNKGLETLRDDVRKKNADIVRSISEITARIEELVDSMAKP